MKINNVIVIGSGLSAYGAIIAALERKCMVTILDIGDEIPKALSDQIELIKKENPQKIFEQVFQLKKSVGMSNLLSKKIPQKTLFGSKFFYKELLLKDGHSFPYTEAQGGYSVAWGGAVLAPQKSDLEDLPFGFESLEESFHSVATHISMPHFKDELTDLFPNFGNPNPPVTLSPSQVKLLKNVEKLNKIKKGRIYVSGQARLATKAGGLQACQYCGMCSNGCVYNAIFSSKQAILELINSGRVLYHSNKRVTDVIENQEGVVVVAVNHKDAIEYFPADYVFVGAGAYNSTRIASNIRKNSESIRFKKTGGFVRPYFSIKKNGFDWPAQNTQANVFLEIKNARISKYWIHSQISTPNEIVIEASGHIEKKWKYNVISAARKFFLSHLVIVMTNLHSKDGPYYEMQINPSKNATGELRVSQSYIKHEKRIDRHLRLLFLQIGFLALPFGKKGVSNGPGYHIGGSLPMGGIGNLGTDYLGRLKGSVKVHFVDTSVLPNIPATTIGFLAMANAHRIAKTTLSL